MASSQEPLRLVKRMRDEDIEQFFTLVRMHLSFMLDLNSDDSDFNVEKKGKPLKWALPFSKKNKEVGKGPEGCLLTKKLMGQLNCLINYLMRPESMIHEGIFRRTGNIKRQQELKSRLQCGEQVELEQSCYSVHDCASLLKSYLSDLSEPLLTESLYTAYCQVSLLNMERLPLALELLILLLPEENYDLLKKVTELLHLVSLRADENRMSTMNLATLFTPHLLWPRRMPAEILHANSQSLSKIVTFMIDEPSKLFVVPEALTTDIRAYFEKKERRRLSPMRQLNESVCDGTTANTVFTFVDRERTAQENDSNPTELALAQLYAHIQSLPDSARKRRLVKNFNKKNGQGTPAVRNEERAKHRRSRSLRDSIKKHLPNFGKNGVITPNANNSSSPETLMKTPLHPIRLARLKHDTPKIKENLHSKPHAKENRDPAVVNEPPKSAVLTRQALKRSSSTIGGQPKRKSPVIAESPPERALLTEQPSVVSTRGRQEDNPRLGRGPCLENERGVEGASTWAMMPLRVGFAVGSCEESPRLHCPAETMMTPRSRKPVVSLSGSDLCQLASLDPWTPHNAETELIVEEQSDSLSSTFRDYLISRSALTASPADLSFSSRTDDYQSLSSKSSSLAELQDLANGDMSESLLYCMEGNDPNGKSPPTRKVCETAI